MEFVAAIVTPVVDYIIKPIWHQLSYVVSYSDYINNLKSAVEKVEKLINEGKREAKESEEWVQKWLIEAEKIIENTEKGACFNVFGRHELSRKANKLVDKVKDIHEPWEICRHGSPSRIQNSGYEDFETRRLTKTQIMETLKDPEVNRIGVYGMGGIGKTMLVKEIAKRVQNDKLFEQVIMVTIGQNSNVTSIQGHFRDNLNLKWEKETQEGRAEIIRKRLNMDKKKILIVLDDIWSELNLEQVGIPCGDEGEGCKILATSRSENVLSNEMNIGKNFEVIDLKAEEAWNFFKKITGEGIETDHRLNKTAKQVVKKCGNLPIALAVVAKTLKGKSLSQWKDALRQLENPVSVDIKEVTDQVYACLKLSFDYLSSKDAKKLFLLCSMFPDDYDIYKENLIMYVMGLKLVQGLNTLGETTDRITTLVDDLKSCCLLQGSEYGDKYVRMHDVVRDVAIYIASKDDKICTFCYDKGLDEWGDEDTNAQKDYTMVFANCSNLIKLPEKLSYPKLELLVLVNQYRGNSYTSIPEAFFEGTKELKVLHLEEMKLLQIKSFHNMKNLRTLILYRCLLGEINEIDKLKNLEILDLSRSDIMELPSSIRQLTQLRKLNLSNCSELKVIPNGVISTLTKLEALHIYDSFQGWGVENNATLLEVCCLSRLTHLYLCIPDYECLPERGAFSKDLKLRTFHIKIGDSSFDLSPNWKHNAFSDYELLPERALAVKIDSITVALVERVSVILHKSELLSLEVAVGMENLLLKLNRSDSPYLLVLLLQNNKDVEYLVSEIDTELSCKAFSELKVLALDSMKGLKTIIPKLHRTVGAFKSLKKIGVTNCENLKYLFPFSILKCLSKLEKIKVSNCKMMKVVFAMENDDEDDKIEARSLRIIHLNGLPSLMGFCGRLQSNENEEIKEEDNQLIANSMRPSDSEILDFEEKEQSQVLQASLPKTFEGSGKLVNPTVSYDRKLRYLISFSNIEALSNLKTIRVVDCDMVEAIVAIENDEAVDKIEFTTLEFIELKGLPRLKGFCCKLPKRASIQSSSEDEDIPFNCQLAFPKLTWVEVDRIYNEQWCIELIANSSQIEVLLLEKNEDVEYLVSEEDIKDKAFSALRLLSLDTMAGLQSIIRGSLPKTFEAFRNLVELSISNCGKLRYVLPFSIVEGLLNLREIYIQKCEMLEAIVAIENDEAVDKIEFIALEFIKLKGLPRLKSFCCKLTKRASIQSINEDEDVGITTIEEDQIVDSNMTPFTAQLVFPNLEKVTVDDQVHNAQWCKELISNKPRVKIEISVDVSESEDE